MDALSIQFLVGLYFVVLDSPVLFAGGGARPLIRFILGVILVVLTLLGISLVR